MCIRDRADAGFGGGERHHEEGGHVTVGGAVVAGKRHEGEIDGIEHELDRHEDHEQVAAEQHAECADEEQDRAQIQIVMNSDRRHQITFLARSTTPTMATSRMSEITSKAVSYTHLRAHETGRNLVC